jgi:hypothetical protein
VVTKHAHSDIHVQPRQLASRLEASGPWLDVDVAYRHVRRWLDEVANVSLHGTTAVAPVTLLPDERGRASGTGPQGAARAMLIESLQHPLSVYDELLVSWHDGRRCRECREIPLRLNL